MNTLCLFFRLFIFRFLENKIPVSAGYLTYTTLLSLVPLIMVVFSVFTFFPMFEQATEQLQSFVYSNFAPNAGDVVQEYLQLFVDNSKKNGAGEYYRLGCGGGIAHFEYRHRPQRNLAQ